MPATATSQAAEQSPKLWARVSPLEWAVGAIVVITLAVLVALEPDILEAPFASTRAIVFTFGGTMVAAVALVLMLRADVHPLIRLVVLGVPLVVVSWWLISPHFIDDVVNDEFSTSISEQQAAPKRAGTTTTSAPSTAPGTAAPKQPTLLGAGQFVGLAGHEGTGDAGVFERDDGNQVLRFENFDIERGPDLELYVVPGRDQRSPGAGSMHLGPLRGNVGNQTYELTEPLAAGDWTVLVWCKAFSVEFVAASLTV
jgi:hypothetical protein